MQVGQKVILTNGKHGAIIERINPEVALVRISSPERIAGRSLCGQPQFVFARLRKEGKQ